MSRRRKQKKNAEFHEEEEYLEPQSDLDNWKINLPAYIDELASADPDERVNVIEKINKIMTARPVGSFLKPYIDELVNNLHDSFFDYSTIEEHNEAMFLLCNISANSYLSFEPYAIALINELLPTLDRALDDESLKLFTLGYICILSVNNKEYSTKVIKKLFSFFKNKKQYNKMSVEATANCIEAISLLVSCFSVATVADRLMDDVCEVLEMAFESSEGPILMAALDLFSLQSENLIERQYVDDNGEEYVDPKPEAEEIWEEFVERFKPSIRSAPSGVDKKDQKAVREKSKAVLGCIEGESLTAKITVNIQTGEVCGAKKLIFMQATKKIARFHFEQMMVVNKGLQRMFGISFLDRSKAELLKLNLKEEIDFSREEAEKERSLSIAKKRHQKERRGFEEY